MPEQFSMFDASDGISSATDLAVGELQRAIAVECTFILDTQDGKV